jgi:hypothetical protein
VVLLLSKYRVCVETIWIANHRTTLVGRSVGVGTVELFYDVVPGEIGSPVKKQLQYSSIIKTLPIT